MTLHSSERDAPAARPDETSAQPAKSSPTIAVDYDAYAHFLENAGLSEAEKRELLQALWSIICSFVQLGYGVHPAQQACGKFFDNPPQAASTLSPESARSSPESCRASADCEANGGSPHGAASSPKTPLTAPNMVDCKEQFNEIEKGARP